MLAQHSPWGLKKREKRTISVSAPAPKLQGQNGCRGEGGRGDALGYPSPGQPWLCWAVLAAPSQAAWDCPCVPLFTIPSPGSDSEHREMDFRLRQECAGAVYHSRLTRNVFSRRNCPKPCFSCYFNGCRALNDNLLPFVFLIFFLHGLVRPLLL